MDLPKLVLIFSSLGAGGFDSGSDFIDASVVNEGSCSSLIETSPGLGFSAISEKL
jgi:hypothetical protein